LKKVYKAGGCERCLDTGYHGRRAVFELLTANQQLRDVILNNPTIADIKDALGRTMFTTLGDNGYALVAEGVTAVNEIERVTGGEG
jgi:type II secretory ATPase GspE/PulE/Tfp pilus assembly ATPase PilB-like protein